MAKRRYYMNHVVDLGYDNHPRCKALLERLVEFTECKEADHAGNNLQTIWAYGTPYRVCSAVAEMANCCGFFDKREIDEGGE